MVRARRGGGTSWRWRTASVALAVAALAASCADELEPLPVSSPIGLALAEIRAHEDELRATTDHALLGSGVIGGGIFEQACRTIGMETFMMALLTAPDASARLLDGITDVYLEAVDRYLGQLGGLIDVFTFWDDVATQQGWMISPQTYVEVIKPRRRDEE